MTPQDPLDFWECRFLQFTTFKPHRFSGEDLNMRCFDDADRFLKWFKQPPGPMGNPCRDERFYIRELSRLSYETAPDSILEIGTCIGLGTLILRILNPIAAICTVDNRPMLPAADGNVYPTGFIAVWNQCNHQQLIMDSATLTPAPFQMVFIDGDHSYEGVKSDSSLAFKCVQLYQAMGRRAIIWHDYHPETAGVIRAVNEFCAEHSLQLQILPDSATVWVTI